jgi:hypothetical protein
LNARERSGKKKKSGVEGNRGGNSPARGALANNPPSSSSPAISHSALKIGRWVVCDFSGRREFCSAPRKTTPPFWINFDSKGRKLHSGVLTYCGAGSGAFFSQTVREGKIFQNQVELINATLVETGGLRFRLEKIIPVRREER